MKEKKEDRQEAWNDCGGSLRRVCNKRRVWKGSTRIADGGSESTCPGERNTTDCRDKF